MIYNKIPEYKIADTLYESECTLVFRGYQAPDSLPVVLKVLKSEAASQERLTTFKHEFEILSKLDLTTVVKPIALADHEDGLVLVMKDLGGQSLDRTLSTSLLSLEQSLTLAVSLTDTVGLIHQQHIIHKDINPSNIVYNPNTEQIYLIDFGLADEAPERNIALTPPSALEGTLEYISPEQTGRMNRTVDYRTDFYSLGVTLYQMLTGKLPFKADDALGMIHSHIARPPIPPHRLNTDIPEMISRIVIKLMAKMADDRYQSAWGLKADLERCLQELKLEGVVHPFELAREDFSGQLRIPKKLYGRDKEVVQLLETFDRVSAGKRELFLVAGYSGIGKTSLIHEAHRHMVEKRGNFIVGKFDQLQRNIPYLAWTQAFSDFANYLLMENEEQLSEWKEIILLAVGGMGRVITDIIPNLELIIGSQPWIPDLGTHETLNRFNYVFLNFIKSIATSEHPLVVFLDDLQWIDAASLNLLQMLMSCVGISNMLVIGAYRENEVNAFHPLSMAIETIRKQEAKVNLLTLGNLAEQTVNELISDTLGHDRSKTVPLTHLVYSKTEGNPFFLFQTLKALTEKKAIEFDLQGKYWKWKIPELKAMKITGNVVELMIEKIRKLSAESQHTLQLAACIGFQFNIACLSSIAEQSEANTLRHLQYLLHVGLIMPLNGHYQFVHDRVQDAAYSLISENERAAVHLRIGKRFHSQMEQDKIAGILFDVVNHLNLGVELITEPAERAQLANLNTTAGRRAKDSIAYVPARNFFANAAATLPEGVWESRYNFMFALYLDWAECEFLTGALEEAEALFQILLGYAKNNLDKAAVYQLRLKVYQVAGKNDEAVTIGLKALQIFGIKIPSDNESLHRETQAETAAIQTNLGNHRISDLANAPEATDPEANAIIGLLSNLAPPAYVSSRPQIFPLITMMMVNYSLKFGPTKESCSAYSTYGSMLCSLFNDPHTGDAFSRMSINLNERFDDLSRKGTVLCLHGNHINFWLNHIATDIPILEKGFRACLNAGDLVFANFIALNIVWQAFECGDALEDVLAFSQKYADFALTSGNNVIYRTICLEQQFLHCLMGETNGIVSFSDKAVNELAYLEQIAVVPIGIGYYHTMKLITAYIMGDDDAALAHAEEAKIMLPASMAKPIEATLYFFLALMLTRSSRNTKATNKDKLLKTLSVYQEKYALWAKNCPENFGSRYALISAEIAAFKGNELLAQRLYEQAIESGKVNGFIHWEAMANEAAAQFYGKRGLKTVAHAYLRKALYCYARWGAKSKVKQLDTLHPWLLRRGTTQSTTFTTHSEQLDITTITKAQLAISSKMEMNPLLSEMMHIVIENAGAQSGFLLLQRDHKWVVVAKREIGKTEVELPQPIGLDENNNISPGVVRFVVRTHKSVMLDDAANQGDFTADPYIKKEQTKSLLCAPLLSRGKLIGILYLENNLSTHAFTSERVQLLEILLSQAATSLENARVYQALKESEEKFHAIFDQTFQFIGMLTPDGTTMQINQTGMQFVGANEKEVIGKPFWETPWWKHSIELQEKLRTAIQKAADGKLMRFEAKHLMHNGEIHYVDFSIKPFINTKGHVVQLIVESRDITERKQVENEIRILNQELEVRVVQRTAQLEAANKELESFSYSVSHDLRAPLRSIDGFSQILLEEYTDKMDEMGQNYLQRVRKATLRMGQLIDDMLGLSRVSRSELNIQQVNLSHIAIEIMNELRESAPQRKTIFNIQDEIIAWADEPLLKIVLENLMGNAWKFTAKNPNACIEFGMFQQEEKFTYFVRDDGAGFDIKFAQKLFGAFQRLHSDTEFPGTGIGLATVQRIIHRHGGKVWAEGEVEKGATFYFSLPKQPHT